MSLDEQKIKAFVKLIKSQSSLFSERDRAELFALVSTLPNDANAITNAIAQWSQHHQDIWNALLPLIAQSSIITRGPSEDFEPINPKDYKGTLINAMRESFPPPEPQQPSSQPSPQPKSSDSQQ